MCDCGDPTITAVGVEKPKKNRVRLALDERFGEHTMGTGIAQSQSWTLRSSLLVSYSPLDRLTLAASVPLVSEWVSMPAMPAAGRQNITGLGDAELSARGVVWRNRRYSPSHLVSLVGGMKFPTAPRITDGAGYPYAEDDQPGSGSFDPFAGVAYGWFGDKFATFASASYRLTTDGRHGYRRGMSVGGSAGVQYQPHAKVAVGLAADVRWAAADTMPNVDAMQVPMRADVPDTGGAMLALTPSVTVAPVERWQLRLAMQVHMGEWLYGAQSESHALLLSTVVDIN